MGMEPNADDRRSSAPYRQRPQVPRFRRPWPHTSGMALDSLVFDRVEVASVAHEAARPDGHLFAVEVHNAGSGRPDRAVVPVEASGTALAMLQARGRSAEDWIATNVARTANAHENDGSKVRALVASAPLRYDSRYVLD